MHCRLYHHQSHTRPSKWWGVTQLQFNNWLILANPVLSALVCSEIHCAFLRKSTRRKNSVSRNSTVRDTLELENTALLNTIPSIWQICTIILHRNFRELKVSQFWVPNLKAYFEFHTNTRYLFEKNSAMFQVSYSYLYPSCRNHPSISFRKLNLSLRT